jgi:crotonobetainyl-CoA:carnitine CoA-transferase CaiB-like acyl-CoA transferase
MQRRWKRLIVTLVRNWHPCLRKWMMRNGGLKTVCCVSVRPVFWALQYRLNMAARHFFEEIEHLKKGTVVATGIPLGLTGTPGHTDRTGAAVGQDNEAVFGELLGMTPEEIRAYVDAGAIETADG